jgi:hypothetical protein
MSLDPMSFAQEHGYRVRNVNDGFPAQPLRRAPGGRRSRGYSAAQDRDDVIVCRDGYIAASGAPDDTLGWCVLSSNAWKLAAVLKGLGELGVIITQCGHSEAVGYAPTARLPELLQRLKVRRRRKAPLGEGGIGVRSTQTPGRQGGKPR